MYLQTVPAPVLKGSTNADLAAWAIELQAALNQANLDKLALRNWAASSFGQPAE